VASGEAFEEAAWMVSSFPGLSVGLHVTLSDGCPVLPRSEVPDLVDRDGHFAKDPKRAGFRYWIQHRSSASQISAEVEAQFTRLEERGLRPDHVDCHHHLHMNPVVFRAIAGAAGKRGIRWIRMPREPLSLVMDLHFPLLEPKSFLKWLVFGLLIDGNLRTAHVRAMRTVNYVYGLSATGRLREKYFLSLLPHIRGVTNEVYLHPDLETADGRAELKTVTSARVRDSIAAHGLTLAGFGNLSAPGPTLSVHVRETA
jgi:predicted glycoside hydrolase/deacetylase ChbG (UPF0249 family)